MSAPDDRDAPARPSLRRVLALGALWAAISAAALAAPGCYGRNCEGGLEVFGANEGEGEMIDEDTWESGPMNGTWLWFPRQRTYIFDLRVLGGRVPYNVYPYISASPDPMTVGPNGTIGSGNLALLSSIGPNRVDVRNDSCSDYYLRLVVEAKPMPPALPADDGGAEAGTNDAGGDDADAGDAGD
ncbi:MAG: hypothetical protein KF850_12555 [Labilithrix sp.]|nr:hypothetical protein [Labilithrix sp.]